MEEVQVFYPTTELKILRKKTGIYNTVVGIGAKVEVRKDVLMQKWIYPPTGEFEWREITMEEE